MKQCDVMDWSMILPCIKHRSSDAEDSTATSQISHQFPLNVIKRTLDRIKHACWGEKGRTWTRKMNAMKNYLSYDHMMSPHLQYEDWLDIVQEGFLALQTRPPAAGSSLTPLVSLLATVVS